MEMTTKTDQETITTITTTTTTTTTMIAETANEEKMRLKEG